ncbi:MAG: tRNA (adenosine(37)-N6)-threonylcarbamoyltransferase complex dimerization subunit type 1 TsaB [Clostridiales bacterium]|nr:tRNA (adenosine(37)-N6)-threonylcarbamoyltransferase complex dimerization subunit type 1 TsaB [Clostridiales bacterium]
MHILTFETTGARASVACIDENGNVFDEESEIAMSHLQSLMPMTESLLKKNGLAAEGISCVAASVGPGSFTGIRIGVSTARAFAQAMGIPCVSVPTLKSFLYNAGGCKGLVCPMLDARRNQVYGGAFAWDSNGGILEVVEGGAYGAGEYLLLLRQGMAGRGISDAVFFGDGADACRGEITDWQRSLLDDGARVAVAPESARFQKASSVAKLALKLCREGRQSSYGELMPMYMRKAEAERKLEAGLLTLKGL